MQGILTMKVGCYSFVAWSIAAVVSRRGLWATFFTVVARQTLAVSTGWKNNLLEDMLCVLGVTLAAVLTMGAV